MLAFLITVLLVFLQGATALFEDQAGKFDWMQRYVGRVDYLYWDQSHYMGKRLLVGTDKNALAAINVHNGSIAWRQILEEGEKGRINTLLHQGNGLVSVSGNGKFVRSWIPSSGFLQWETVLKHDPSSVATAVFVGNRRVESIAVLSGEILFNLKPTDGSEIFKVLLPDSDTVKYQHLHSIDRESYIVGVVAESHVVVVVVNGEGKIKTKTTVKAPWFKADTSCLITSDNLVCHDSTSMSIQTLVLLGGDTFIPTLLTDVGIKDSVIALEKAGHEISSGKSGIFVCRLQSGFIGLLKVGSNGLVTSVNTSPRLLSAQMTRHGDKQVLFTLESIDTEIVKMSGVDISTGSSLKDLSHKITYSKSYGQPLRCDALLFTKKDGHIGYKAIIRSEDYTLHLVHKAGRIAWRREEALAYILAVEMVDLPVSESQAKFEDEFGSQQNDVLTMFVNRLTSQVGQVKSLIQYIIQRMKGHRHHQPSSSVDDDEEIEIEEDDDDDDDDEEELTRDEFNLNKIILAVTRPGKLFGIRSQNGHIIWHHYISKIAPFDSNGKDKLLLFVMRTTAHIGLDPQCLVLGKSKVNGKGLLYAFNPVTGAPVADIPSSGKNLLYTVLQASMFSEPDNNFLKGVLILDDTYTVHTYPASYKKTLKTFLPAVFFHTVNIIDGEILGYRVVNNRGKIQTENIWSINMQQNLQTITNVLPKRASEVVHSQGRVLGDRSVLYKYLNPNLAVVTAEGEEPSLPSQKTPSNFLNVYLIDLISGNIVFHATHRRVRGPVHVVHSENWVVYNFYSQKNRRNEMVILEMYEGKEQSNSTAFSSFNPPPVPMVMRQAYIFPAHISTMAATITEKGITSKHVIVSLKFGGLLSLPKAFLDPRRPVTPTQQHMEEGTIPYVPEIPINMEAIVNYNKSVYGINGIHTGSAGLESTSLILAYGLDLFYTRVNPSKMFDVLKDDFDYIFISSVLIGMIVVSVVSQKLAARKALNRAWR